MERALLVLTALITKSVGSWCQSHDGSCVGQRHSFEKKEISQLTGDPYHGTVRFADWDGDGDTDVLVGEAGAIWLHERLSQNTFQKRQLLKLEAQHPGELFNHLFQYPPPPVAARQNRFEVVDWDGNSVVYRRHIFLLSFHARVHGGSMILELLRGYSKSTEYYGHLYLAYFDSAADGSFLTVENPLEEISLTTNSEFWSEFYVADWNSDGWLDILHIVLDWNGDGAEDVVVLEDSERFHLYEFHEGSVRTVPRVFENITSLGENPYPYQPYPAARAAFADWDQDGDVDLIFSSQADGKLHYHEMISGSWTSEDAEHPFSNISLVNHPQPVVVDWDNDGDMDLFLGPPDGRFFEQLADGTLHEWPLEQSPVKDLVKQGDLAWRVLDCDADGDFDLLRLRSNHEQQVQACEHEQRSPHQLGTLRCDDDFLCLGTNLSHFKNSPGGPLEGLGDLLHLDLGDLKDGRLKFISVHDNAKGAVLWSAGFCAFACLAQRSAAALQAMSLVIVLVVSHIFIVSRHKLGRCIDAKHVQEQMGKFATVEAFVSMMRQPRRPPRPPPCSGSPPRPLSLRKVQAPAFAMILISMDSTRRAEAPVRKALAQLAPKRVRVFALLVQLDRSRKQERMKSIINCATSVLVASSRQQGTTLAAPVRLVPLRQRWAVSHASPVQQALIQVKPVESAAPVLQAPFHLEQGEKLLVTTSIAHFLLSRPCNVTFARTGVPDLESSSWTWRVKATSYYHLALEGEKSSMPLDTSKGHLHVKFPQLFVSAGFARCPLIGWCVFFLAATVGTALQLTWRFSVVLGALGLCTGSFCFALRRRHGLNRRSVAIAEGRGTRTPLAKRRHEFLQEWQPLALQRCSRGPDRSMSAGKLQRFVQFFDSFIKERSMYYVCSNIVKPLTKPFQLSFVELVGATKIQWFVSHYWGMPLRHFSDAIRKHAQSVASSSGWQDAAYWICTFSNSQWHVKDELGHGKWEDSSFYLALRSPECKGTTMIIDDTVQPLQRIWCLFEVYQTICLSRSDHFQGLLLCTSAGVLQQGNAGTDVAVAVAKTVAELDTCSAQATDEEDRQMIHSLIEQMPGGFHAMNSFVRETICKALKASHLHYEATLSDLMQTLTSEPSSSAPPAPVGGMPAGPTLLTSSVYRTPCETKVDAT
ncbi:Extracellular matrix protein FRAS1 [Durusdinium trenchii]|uniref:Extracellular matrix protein FRAS1 n=1 Tax=Durusdinium trenchii TaxID=1381693 RepID=A0ABP0I195_9DINO